MRLGDLVDKIRQLEQAEHDLDKARLSLDRGGSPETMARKRELVEFYEREVDRLRGEEIDE